MADKNQNAGKSKPAKIIKNIGPETLSLYAMRGHFDGVTYFITKMKLKECASQLHFEEQAEKAFEERVQRAVNTERAGKIFETYLKREGLRFFNSLVVVMMPPKEATRGYYEFEPFESEDGRDLGFGTLTVIHDIDRVVVDGQHRLYSLRLADEHTRSADYKPKLGLLELEVPVVFLAFKDVGGDGLDKTYENLYPRITRNARSIFVDLNKNAKKPDRNTLLLLDDRDFSPICARSLLGQSDTLERFTKWHMSGTTLKDTDVWFTTIDVVSYAAREALGRELVDEVEQEFDLPNDEERKRAIAKHFESPLPPLAGLAPKGVALGFFERVSFFSDWQKLIKKECGKEPPLQPEMLELDAEQKKAVKNFRRSELLATVLGQQATFGALVDALPKVGKNPKESLDELLRRIDALYKKGVLKREHPLWLDVLIRPGNKMKLTGLPHGRKLIEALLLKTYAESVEKWVDPDSDIGNKTTVAKYKEALSQLKDL